MNRMSRFVREKNLNGESDLIQAGKAIHDALKGALSSETAAMVGKIVHKEMDSRVSQVAKSYETRLADMRKSYEQRLFDMQSSNDKALEDMRDLIKSVSVPGVTEDVGMEIVSRTMKMLETKMEKRLDEVKNEIEGKLKAITESVIEDMGEMTKGFDDKQELLINFVKNFQVHNQFVVPENSIHTNVEVKQLPSQVNVSVPESAIQVQANAIFKESPAPVVNFSVPEKAIQVEHKTILEEMDKVSEKTIHYDQATGRPSKIDEKIIRIKK